MRVYRPAEGPDRLPQAMIEGATEYDWAELPDSLKDVMRHAAAEFQRWTEVATVSGELATEEWSLNG